MDVLERVGSSRMMLEGKFPYPSAVDCMRYAIQEMAEYDDARMRQDQPDHKRNNERQPDPRKELGQAFYMVLSGCLALKLDVEIEPPLDYEGIYEEWLKRTLYAGIKQDLGRLCADVFCAVDEIVPLYERPTIDELAGLATDLLTSMGQLANDHGWDVDDLITETCEAFEAKHLGVQA